MHTTTAISIYGKFTRYSALIVGFLFYISTGCTSDKTSQTTLESIVTGSDSLIGKPEFITTPFVTAGDRTYMIGAQNGQFPPLGFHIEGEMGGVWDHPIKLLDGFTAALLVDNKPYCLDQAATFINYPYANKHVFQLPDAGLRVDRFQYVPDGQEAVVVEFSVHNTTETAKKIDFEWTTYSDLRPTWLGERTNMADGADQASWDNNLNAWIVKDSLNPWFVVVGSSQIPAAHRKTGNACVYKPSGKGCITTMVYSLDIPAKGTVSLPFTIAGSYISAEKVKETFSNVQRNARQNLELKRDRYQRIASSAKLTIPDKDIQQAFTWVKYNTDWLIRDVPEIGRGLSAGLPDYPWWFGIDNEYALQGAIATGRRDLVLSTIALINKVSEKTNGGNGRIMHEVSTNGAVYNPGNVNETPQFASLIWDVYQWTGDKKFLAINYPIVKKGLSWLLTENDKDGNLLPDGFGIMEIHGLNSEMVDVAVYTQKAFADASQMATEMSDTNESKKYAIIADKLKTKINTDFWVPAFNSYADFIGTPQQAIHLIDGAIIRADTLKKPWAVTELKATKAKLKTLPPNQKQGMVLYHNYVVNTPMATGIADSAKAKLALQTANRFVNPFGVFVTGIDRDESAGTDVSSAAQQKKVFSYTGAVMTLPTGVQTVAENNYSQPDKALGYLKRLTRSFSYALPGSIYEVSPDYGMMTQAWTLYGYAIPIIRQFFGIHPDASHKRIRIQPQMPTTWPTAKLENIEVGDNLISMTHTRQRTSQEIDISQKKTDWTIQLAFPQGKFKKWTVNGNTVLAKSENGFDTVEAAGANVQVAVE